MDRRTIRPLAVCGASGWAMAGGGGGLRLLCCLLCSACCAVCCYCTTAGRGASEVYFGCCVPAPCDVQHRKPAERGLLSFLRLLRAFLLHVIKRNQARSRPRLAPSGVGPELREFPMIKYCGGVVRKGPHLLCLFVIISFVAVSCFLVCCCWFKELSHDIGGKISQVARQEGLM